MRPYFRDFEGAESGIAKRVSVLQRVMESSFRYTWMHHIMNTLDLTVEDMQPLFALYSAEIDEYNSIMEEL